MRPSIVATAAVAAILGLAAPATSQNAPEPKVNQLIVYGDDKCPESTDDTITVCARKDEGERFRIPAPLRESSSPANEAWTNKVAAYETVGRSGTMSCSPAGAGGATGCLGKLIDAAYAEKKIAPDVRFGELIAAERAKRLSTIDQEAAETQKRVEQLENEVEARDKAQQAAQKAAEQGADVPQETTPPAKP
jgi:hypothetical protein